MPNVFIFSCPSPSLSGPCHKTPASDIPQGTATPGQTSRQPLGRALLDAMQPQKHTFWESYGEIVRKVQMFLWSEVTMQG